MGSAGGVSVFSAEQPKRGIEISALIINRVIRKLYEPKIFILRPFPGNSLVLPSVFTDKELFGVCDEWVFKLREKEKVKALHAVLGDSMEMHGGKAILKNLEFGSFSV